MADHDDSMRFLRLAEAILGAHAYIAGVLASLPLRVDIPDLHPQDADGAQRCLTALDRARTLLVPAQPISAETKALLTRAIVDWFTAYELLILTRMADGPAPWRYDAIDACLARIMVDLELVDGDLGGDDQP